MAETTKAPETAVEEPKLEKVVLTTWFSTNDQAYGGPEGEDENGDELVYTVEVPADIAEDLRRRQRVYDRQKREMFQGRKFNVTGSGKLRQE